MINNPSPRSAVSRVRVPPGPVKCAAGPDAAAQLPRTILNSLFKGPRRLILSAALWITAVPATAASSYLFVLPALSARLPPRAPSARKLRFDVIVPAHNEHAVIANIIASLQLLDWPSDQFRIVVVADNCTDDTAAIATAAGAHVMQRVDQEQRGKGYRS